MQMPETPLPSDDDTAEENIRYLKDYFKSIKRQIEEGKDLPESVEEIIECLVHTECDCCHPKNL